jgi:DNA invertase Pin-like site-specific DNA recombinase
MAKQAKAKQAVTTPAAAQVAEAVAGAVVGYARVSTTDQLAGLEAQQRDLAAAGCQKIFSEQTSAAGHRPQLEAMLDYARAGDVLIATKPDRLARSTMDLLAIEAQLKAKGVALCILSMGGQQLDTRTPTGRLMLTILAGIAEFERELMLERQREGIAKAKGEGKYKGRKPTARAKSAEVLKLHQQRVPVAEIARQLGIGSASAFRIIRAARDAA